MRSPGIVQRHPELRWVASVIVIVAGAAAITTSVSGVFRTDSELPATNPEQLVAQVHAPRATGYFGTIVARVELGLPTALRAVLADVLPVGSALLSGSHTMRYWYGGDDRQRVAIVGPNSEQDVFRNGAQLLSWDTKTRVAQRSTIAGDGTGAVPFPMAVPSAITPPQLAARALDETADEEGDASDTTLRSGEKVAGRSTYELDVSPESNSSLISGVHIEIDGRESLPLGVQVFTHGREKPVVDVSFTSISFTEPAAQNFTFTPPAGADVRTATPSDPLGQLIGRVTRTGTGWLTVGSYRASTAQRSIIDKVLAGDLRPVKGSWGTGQLLQSRLINVLITDEGRVVAGAVTPSVLYRAAGK